MVVDFLDPVELFFISNSLSRIENGILKKRKNIVYENQIRYIRNCKITTIYRQSVRYNYF